MNMQFIPVLTPGGANSAAVKAKPSRTLGDTLNEAVVVVFFSLGPAIGATIFLLWFGGLMWGVLSSFLH